MSLKEKSETLINELSDTSQVNNNNTSAGSIILPLDSDFLFKITLVCSHVRLKLDKKSLHLVH